MILWEDVVAVRIIPRSLFFYFSFFNTPRIDIFSEKECLLTIVSIGKRFQLSESCNKDSDNEYYSFYKNIKYYNSNIKTIYLTNGEKAVICSVLFCSFIGILAALILKYSYSIIMPTSQILGVLIGFIYWNGGKTIGLKRNICIVKKPWGGAETIDKKHEGRKKLKE